MKREETREIAMQIIFQMEGQKNFSTEMNQKMIRENENQKIDKKYFDKILTNFTENKEKTDQIIDTNTDNWSIARMNKVDLAILRLAVTEILYIENIPVAVSINEAVNLAKKFGTEQSGKFVNGVLGKIVKALDLA